MPRLRGVLLFFLLAGAVVVSACKKEPPRTVLQPLDFEQPESDGSTFDPDSIVSESVAFTDSEALDAKAIQSFLAKTPYGRSSFLGTYQSNGVRAAGALVSVARQHRINPIVFLVFAEAMQGLVGERDYPFPPERVEYVFRCGCLDSKNCIPDLAGFDRQIDCLGRALRASLDEIKANRTTMSGWGPDVASVTLDSRKVTPDSDATAALYEFLPIVAEGKEGGTWMLWNLWNLYTDALGYVAPASGADGSWISDR